MFKICFSFYFMNKDISLNILSPVLKIDLIILDTIMEGTVSQVLYLDCIL